MANIQKYLDDIKKALFGREVRSSIHDAIEAINKETERTTASQEHLDSTFKQLIINAGQSNSEVVDARVEANGTPHATLGDRLDSIDSKFDITNKEVIESRTDKYNITHKDLKTRLDDIDSLVERIVVDVTKFGAKCDGITDDTVSIQNAIDYVGALGGGTVLFPNGTTVFRQILLKNFVNLKGIGTYNTVLKHIGDASGITNNDVNSIGYFTISDLSIELNANTKIGIEFTRVHSSKISNVLIIGKECTGIGISFDEGTTQSSYYNSCYDVTINGINNNAKTLDTGFRFQNSANSNRLINCRTNSVKNGVKIETDYTNHIVVFGCAFENFDTGVYINGDICQVISNRFENGTTGVEITATSDNNTLVGNLYSRITTHINNNNPTGINNILDYGNLLVKYLSHEQNGGWKSNMDMRSYGVRNCGFVELKERTSPPISSNGILTYSDGDKFKPVIHNTPEPLSIPLVYHEGLFRPIVMFRSGFTHNRPTTNLYQGYQFFDKTLNKPIWYNGTNWIDASGSIV